MSQSHGSRSNQNIESPSDTYTTIDLYLGSQDGAVSLAPFQNINAGFSCVLANPIILDINSRYAMAITKAEYDLSQYTDRFYDISIFCDLLEYQYDHSRKTQLLYRSYGNMYQAGTDNIALGLFDVVNVAWKFINQTQKQINRIDFWILDDTGQPLKTPLPPNFSYPSNFNILIKKVPSTISVFTQL